MMGSHYLSAHHSKTASDTSCLLYPAVKLKCAQRSSKHAHKKEWGEKRDLQFSAIWYGRGKQSVVWAAPSTDTSVALSIKHMHTQTYTDSMGSRRNTPWYVFSLWKGSSHTESDLCKSPHSVGQRLEIEAVNKILKV